MDDDGNGKTALSAPSGVSPILLARVVLIQTILIVGGLMLWTLYLAPKPLDHAASPATPAPVATSVPTAARTLLMATCSGSIDDTPDEYPWSIDLTTCDKAIDGIVVQSGYLSKWSVCGGAESFDISIEPRRVTVTSDAIHCSKTKSEVTVTYLGYAK